MIQIILYAVGSPILVDIVDSGRRCGHAIVAGIRNVPGESYLDEGVPLLERSDVTDEIARLPFILPLFQPANRRSALADARGLGFGPAAILVDSTTTLAGTTRISEGVYVNAGGVIGGGCEIGAFAFVNRGANIGHHVKIGEFASIGPGAILTGTVSIGEDAVIGAGAVILPKVTIGAGARIAPGAVVARDVPAGGFAAGNPARIMRSPPDGAV
jgi:UDP-3-O-[3-hydroxymyristoyl] glucosamine N-acyltransferase